MDVTWTEVGQALVSLVVGAGVTAGWWSRRATREARSQAEAAQAGAARVVADAESAVYRLLVERMQALEANVQALSQQLSEARQREMALEQHIFHLENLMRRAGMDVPERVRKLG